MELSCKGCLSQLFLQAPAWHYRARVAFWSYCWVFRMELSCKSCLAKLFLKLWHGTVVQRLPCKALSQSFAWHSRAKAGLRSNFVSIRIELSCKNKLFPKLLHGSLVQKLPYEAMSWGFAWNCRAKVSPWSYLLAFAWNYAKASFQYYFSSFYVELSAKVAFQTYFWASVWNCRAKVDLQSYLSRWNGDPYFQNAARCS